MSTIQKKCLNCTNWNPEHSWCDLFGMKTDASDGWNCSGFYAAELLHAYRWFRCTKDATVEFDPDDESFTCRSTCFGPVYAMGRGKTRDEAVLNAYMMFKTAGGQS